MKSIPILLLAFRVAAGPVLLWGAAGRWPGIVLASIIVLALMSDIFDGIIARKLGTSTPFFRRCDSAADTVFYICVAATLWVWHRQAIVEHARLLLCLLGLELARIVFDLIKFQTYASYHSYLSKAWGIALATAATSIVGFSSGSIVLTLAIAMGIASDLEGLTISIALPSPATDVRSIRHALRIRKQEKLSASCADRCRK